MVPTTTVLAAAAAAVALISGPAPQAPPAAAPTTPTVSAPATPATPFRTPPATAGPVGRSWLWPLTPRPDVVRRFDVGPQRWSAGHRGVDLGARPGVVVRAPAAGVVHFAGVVAGRPVLSISHADGLISSFEPVTSALRPGQPVSAEDVIGAVSALPGHCYPGTCLHWGVRRGETYLDPLLFVRGVLRPIVLKPLAGLA